MCYIIRLDCRNAEDQAIAQHLQNVAEEQINHFSIHPWHHGCTENIYMYVALTRPHGLRGKAVTIESLQNDRPNVCGWMTVRHEKGEAEVMLLASRQSADRSYGGVGTALLDLLYTDCLEGKLNNGVPTKFIHLVSLPNAKPFYMQVFRDKKTGKHTTNSFGNPKAFFEMKQDSYHLYMPVRALPSARFMRQTTRKRPESPTNTDLKLLLDLRDELDDEHAKKLEHLLQSDDSDNNVLYLIAAYSENDIEGVEEMLDSL